MDTFHSDQPIQSQRDDLFNRAAFCTRIASVIKERKDSSSLILGLYGPWGDGKTSSLAMIREALSDSKDVITLNYNPWFFRSSLEAITQAFFASIAEAFGREPGLDTEKLGKLLNDYGQAVPYIGKAIESLGKNLNSVSLDEKREELNRIISSTDKKLVVFIDDIDRLDRREIQTIFKIVRLAADFRNTVYILAFDDLIVSDALGEAYASGSAGAGRSFLEKIIQVPLNLPSADQDTLHNMALKACETTLHSVGYNFTERAGQEFANALLAILRAEIRTPRQIKRFDNVISFACPILATEVNMFDLILLETIRAFYPATYSVLKEHYELFARGPDSTTRERVKNPFLEKALDATSLPPDKKASFQRNVVDHLFPRMKENHFWPHEWDVSWKKDKRVCSQDYCQRYFAYGIPTDDIADAHVGALILALSNADTETATTHFTDAVKAGNIQKLIEKLRAKESEISLPAAETLINVLSSMSDQIPYGGGGLTADWTLTQAGILCSHAIQNMDPDTQTKLIARLVENCKYLPFIVEVLYWSFQRPSDDGNRGFVNEDQQKEIVKNIIGRFPDIQEILNSHKAAKSRLKKVLFHIYYFGDDNQKNRIIDQVTCYATQSVNNATEILRLWTGDSWELETGVAVAADFDRDNYNALSKYIDFGVLINFLEEQYGSAIDSDSYPYKDRDESPEALNLRYARQFAFLHRNPLVEDTTTLDEKPASE